MSKYASLLFSPEKYHEIGPFRFPVYHDLNPGEIEAIEKANRQQSKNAFKSIKLAQRIAADKGITVKEAVEVLKKAGEDEVEDIMYSYGEELEELQDSNISAVTQQVLFVTVFMQYRGEVQLEGEWKPCPDWTEADTRRTPGKYLEQIFNLIMWERDGWPPEGAEGNDQESPKPIPTRKRS
jgi:hypothetical protein